MDSLYHNKYFWIIVGAGLLLTILSFLFFQPMMAVFYGVFNIGVGLFIWKYADDYILGKVNTYEEIVGKGNVAYALFLLSISLIIVACYLAAFIVFFTLGNGAPAPKAG